MCNTQNSLLLKRLVVINVLGQPVGPILMGPTGCSKTLITNYQSTLRNIPEISFRPRWKSETTQISASYEHALALEWIRTAVQSVHISLYQRSAIHRQGVSIDVT